MFHDGGYMVGMHGWWWLFRLLVIGAVLIYGWGRPGRRECSAGGSPRAFTAKLRRCLVMARGIVTLSHRPP